MDKLRLSAQLYTLRDFTKNKSDFLETLHKVAAIGYDSFQYSGVGFDDATYVKKCLDESQLILSATHTSPDLLKNNINKVINDHHLWNCKYVGIGMMPESYRLNEKGIIEFAKEYSEVGAKLKENGLKLVYHNHDFEFQKFNGRLIMDILLEESDSTCFDMELDTYWVQAGGGNPEEWIRKVNGRMEYIHFKDMAMNGRDQIFSPIGEGNLSWDSIIKACRETSVKWIAVEQDICEGSPFDALATSYNNLINRYKLQGEK